MMQGAPPIENKHVSVQGALRQASLSQKWASALSVNLAVAVCFKIFKLSSNEYDDFIIKFRARFVRFEIFAIFIFYLFCN